jgi:hypothetical protein
MSEKSVTEKWEEHDVGGWITLNWISRQTGCGGSGEGPVEGACEHGNGPSLLHKTLESS